MVVENPTWGAPRIHGELLMLGFNVSERTISRWMKRAPRDPEPARRWLSFLRSHREAIAAMDFFTVPTITFSVLHCFFVIRHDRRRILHFNVTKHRPNSWIYPIRGARFQKDLDIAEYTDPEHDPMIPRTPLAVRTAVERAAQDARSIVLCDPEFLPTPLLPDFAGWPALSRNPMTSN
jgi:hypothetical protein